MSNELHFPVRLLERGPDDFCILVSHEPNLAWGEAKQAGEERRNKTRSFCNWIRKTFPHVPTEFRYVNTRVVRIRGRNTWGYRSATRTINCDKHFVAYGLKKNELMMTKLAWVFKTQPVCLATGPCIEGSFTVNAPGGFRPSDELKKRIEAKTKPKALSTAT